MKALPGFATPEQFRGFIRSETVLYAKVIKAAGVREGLSMKAPGGLICMLLLLLLLFPSMACCQQPITLSELIARGGKKVSKEDLMKMLKGSTISGLQASNPTTQFTLTLKGDGSASGHVSTADNTINGTWEIRGEGDLCTSLVNVRGTRLGSCGAFYSYENRYYYASNADPSGRVVERRITKN